MSARSKRSSTPRFPRIAQASVLVLVGAGLLMAGFNERLYREQQAKEAAVQARILAASVTGALAFDDTQAAQDHINALSANPNLLFAGAYDARGVLVAAAQREGVPVLAYAPAHPPVFERGDVVVSADVSQGGTHLGTIQVKFRVESWPVRLFRYAGVALLMGMALVVVIALGMAQAALGRANQDLRQQADDLADAYARLRAESEEREKTEAALRQSQKMEAIGRLTGGVAHDFNNLLMVASSALDLMSRTEDPQRLHKLTDAIRQAVDRGASLTNQLLAFSRQTATRSEVIDPRASIEGMKDLLERSLREDIGVRLDLPPSLWPVECDPDQLEVAILNVAVNARDAMPNGGLITVRGENCADLNEGSLQGDYVKLAIADTGEGIPEDVLAHVFEPFFTTKGVGKGTGLGLSQVFGFARAAGGEARIESDPGKGTTVILYLRRSEKQLSAGKGSEAPSPLPAGEPLRARILLVEDDDGVAEMASDMLGSLGYRIVRAADGAAALELLERPNGFDLVFSDMLMPGEVGGIDIARTVKARHPELPVVLTTGFSEAAAEASREGWPLLRKPYRLEELDRAISQALRSGDRGLESDTARSP